jgi:hypothetical protein
LQAVEEEQAAQVNLETLLESVDQVQQVLYPDRLLDTLAVAEEAEHFLAVLRVAQLLKAEVLVGGTLL